MRKHGGRRERWVRSRTAGERTNCSIVVICSGRTEPEWVDSKRQGRGADPWSFLIVEVEAAATFLSLATPSYRAGTAEEGAVEAIIA
jgi:hypothetical protein